MDSEVIEHYLREIEETGKGLTKWEDDFIDSITAQFEETRRLSPKQCEILERIYAEKTKL